MAGADEFSDLLLQVESLLHILRSTAPNPFKTEALDAWSGDLTPKIVSKVIQAPKFVDDAVFFFTYAQHSGYRHSNNYFLRVLLRDRARELLSEVVDSWQLPNASTFAVILHGLWRRRDGLRGARRSQESRHRGVQCHSLQGGPVRRCQAALPEDGGDGGRGRDELLSPRSSALQGQDDRGRRGACHRVEEEAPGTPAPQSGGVLVLQREDARCCGGRVREDGSGELLLGGVRHLHQPDPGTKRLEQALIFLARMVPKASNTAPLRRQPAPRSSKVSGADGQPETHSQRCHVHGSHRRALQRWLGRRGCGAAVQDAEEVRPHGRDLQQPNQRSAERASEAYDLLEETEYLHSQRSRMMLCESSSSWCFRPDVDTCELIGDFFSHDPPNCAATNVLEKNYKDPDLNLGEMTCIDRCISNSGFENKSTTMPEQEQLLRKDDKRMCMSWGSEENSQLLHFATLSRRLCTAQTAPPVQNAFGMPRRWIHQNLSRPKVGVVKKKLVCLAGFSKRLQPPEQDLRVCSYGFAIPAVQ
ncbi:hypothetical protein SELMODRAFT_403194 [Selaginella moellendorffii]|uniref:Uncharacterized protein n=1 Tax=Selaginella moellendorffii TaxID=88036 RepID=D8QTD6_SELML|nr:hypothetical protein SELMODRAFT_403194 [Selaginella moellendorffii]